MSVHIEALSYSDVVSASKKTNLPLWWRMNISKYHIFYILMFSTFLINFFYSPLPKD